MMWIYIRALIVTASHGNMLYKKLAKYKHFSRAVCPQYWQLE